MRATLPDLAIELTAKEQALAWKVDFEFSKPQANEPWQPVGEAMQELMASLLERNAIPLPRRKFFTDPEYFIGGHGRSHLQVFEKNGTRGDAIFRHPNFVKYLRYFLYGPDLPKAVIDDFQRKVIDCGKPFTSGDGNTVAEFARQLTRTHRLEPHTAAEEFYKLSLDSDLDAGDARSVRDSVKTVR